MWSTHHRRTRTSPPTATMDDAAQALRDKIKTMYSEREAMEMEMAAISTRLSAPDAPGLRGPLVDAEGFPIAGVDLYSVRADRGRWGSHRTCTSQRC